MEWRDVLEGAGRFVGTLIGLTILLVPATFYREVCTRASGEITIKNEWSFSPIAWFAIVTYGPNSICETETMTQWAFGHIPVVGERFERMAGGPESPAYYE